jgi:hypothetical protein
MKVRFVVAEFFDADRQTDRTKLAFRHSANVHTKQFWWYSLLKVVWSLYERLDR